MRPVVSIFALAFVSAALHAQPQPAAYAPSQPDPPHREWKAAWVTHPTAPLRDPVVLHFRRMLTLSAAPTTYIVRVSADNRFVLFVNGQRVGDGPARGDLDHWRYEKYDLAPFLHTGQNYVTATVWNFGVYAPLAQFTDRTAFLLESETTGDLSLSTPEGWMVEEEPGQMPLGRNTVSFRAYMASGPGEEIDASRYDWNWNKARKQSLRPLGSCRLATPRQHLLWCQSCPLRRHHRRQRLGPRARHAPSHGVHAEQRR